MTTITRRQAIVGGGAALAVAAPAMAFAVISTPAPGEMRAAVDRYHRLDNELMAAIEAMDMAHFEARRVIGDPPLGVRDLFVRGADGFHETSDEGRVWLETSLRAAPKLALPEQRPFEQMRSECIGYIDASAKVRHDLGCAGLEAKAAEVLARRDKSLEGIENLPARDLHDVLLKLGVADEFAEFTKPDHGGKRHDQGDVLLLSVVRDLERLAAPRRLDPAPLRLNARRVVS